MGLFDSLKGITGNKNVPAPKSTAIPQNAKKILVVEDDQMLGSALETRLKTAGYNTVRAENGQIGLEIAVSEKPDLILLDIMMPVMDGKMMLKKLREIPEFKTLPVIVLTNAGDLETMKQTQIYYNATAFFVKTNVSLDNIITRIQSILQPTHI